MKLVGYARTSEELTALRHAGATEAILCHRELSRLGSLDGTQIQELAAEARSLGVRPVLEWDILMTDPGLIRAISVIKGLDLTHFGAVRVQDPAAYEYLLQHPSQPSLQLVLETGNQNFEAIQRWREYGGHRVERVVLSVQIPKTTLVQHIAKLDVPVEVLGLGPVLLLYTPRHLLSNQKNDFEWLKNESEFSRHFMEATASSEESFHSGFRVIENAHGTLVHHPKDYCLVDQLPELMKMGLGAFRVDFRLEDPGNFGHLTALREILDTAKGNEALHAEKAQGLIAALPRKVTRCFYQANATDVLFKKLKNTKIQRQDSGYIGEVAEISRNSHLIIHLLGKHRSLRRGQSVKFINPEGAVQEYTIDRLQNLDQQDVEEVAPGDFAVIPYIKLVPPKSAVYSSI